MSDDATSWFEPLYAAAEAGDAVVPWHSGAPTALLVEWTAARALDGRGARAVIVGCGLGDERVRELVTRYVDAWERGDVAAVVAMLTDDATFSMPPNAAWFRGRAAIEAFLPTGPMSMPRRFVPVEANGQVAFGTYLLEDGRFRANAIHLIDLDGDRIRDITAFLDRTVFPAFGLPDHLPA